ncbi:hydrolase 1, exosortase A system-associated [Rhodovibrio sodomensis]|uniref:Hydrolase 1, exosortase A system-associated n=1 Tax=Rhodovibrio sodomensis TaxID=1088 RepID=A0ABS1DER1_9PROT|nr:hydrolase 1, exosortase A system-associated [Rhodovibrio sodomensis]MBK1668956.1 hydrolase 1, exosortase A system-associated [Rhodovibrio sodomensis]
MTQPERACSFTCAADRLIGILHPATETADVLVVIVVGGPQYRIGAHRQFVDLARRLAADGWPVFRFDYRGMGDATGELGGFETVDADIRAAIDAGLAQSGARRVVLWGLCDAASAIAFYAGSDPRVAGIVLANPWVRTETGAAQARLKSYYSRRLVSRDFLTKLARGRVDLPRAAGGVVASLAAAVRRKIGLSHEAHDLPTRMAAGLARFAGNVLILLSDRDLTADEFRQVAAEHDWRARAFGKGRAHHQTVTLARADHTFSQPGNPEAAAQATLRWLQSAICGDQKRS